MIFGNIKDRSRYAGVHAGVARALEAEAGYTAENFADGSVQLDGERLFLNFAKYETHPAEGQVCEAHRKYIDVMYMVEGCETIYVKDVSKVAKITRPYEDAIEALLGTTDQDAVPVRLSAGEFVVLFPEDAHTPGCDADGKSSSVKKIIGKVMVDY